MPLRSPFFLPFKRTRKGDKNFDYQIERNWYEIESHLGLLAGQTGPYDAIVDANLTSSDPANRNYRGIYEALTDLDADGYVGAVIAVRPGTYAETAACTVTTLKRVTLVGFSHGTAVSDSADQIIWQQANNIFTMSGDTRVLIISGFRIEPLAGTQTQLFSVSQLFMSRSEIHDWDGGASQSVGCTYGYYHDCLFDGLMNWGSYVQLTNCDWIPARSGGGSKTQTIASVRIHATGLVVGLVNGNHTATLPAQATIDGYMTDQIIAGSGPSLGFTFAQSAGTLDMRWNCKNTFLTNVTLTSPKYYNIQGEYGVITVQTSPVNGGKIDAVCEQCDITGPAEIDIAVTLSTATFRGERVTGTLRNVGTRGAGTTFLTAIALLRSWIELVTNNTGGHATAVPYNLDASSQRNVIIHTGSTSWGAAGINSGSNNRIITETTDTVAAAGVTTHEAAADPHTGYQKESEKGAANGYASLDASTLVPDAQIPAAIARDAEVILKSGAVTGWTAATGSATRTTFDTTTVTLPELAERVKAIIDDLLTREVIDN